MRRIVFILLFALVFTIPWEGMVAFEVFGTLTRAIGLGAAALGLATIVGTGHFRRLTVIHYVMGLFALWALLSLTWTASPGETRMKVMTYVQLAAMAWLIWEFAPTRLRQVLLMHAFILGGCVALATQWISMSSGYRASRIGVARFGGGGVSFNVYNVALVVSIAFAMFHASKKESTSKLLRLMYWGYCPLAVFGILMTGSRTGFLVLLFAAALIVLSHVRLRPAYALVLLAIAAVFLVKARDWMPETTYERIATIGKELRSGDWSDRRYIWHSALKIFPEHPLIGTGAGSFGAVVTKELPQNTLHEHPAAHNSYLSILIELGVIGLFLFSLMLVLSIAYALNMPRRERLLWVVVLAAWAVTSCAINTDAGKLTWFIVGLLTSQYGMLVRQGALIHARKPILRVRRRWVPLVGGGSGTMNRVRRGVPPESSRAHVV